MSKLRELLSGKVKSTEWKNEEKKIDTLMKQYKRMIAECDDKLVKSWKFEDEFLLRFIRGRKYNLKSAFDKLKNNVNAKRNTYPEIFETLYPSALQKVLEKRMMRILKHRDDQGRHIVVFKPENFDPNETPVDDLLRVQIMVTWEMMSFKETQLNGIIVLVDGSGFSAKQVKVVTPTNVQKYVTLAVKCSPTRFKGCHILFLPQVMHFGIQMVRPLLPEKVRSRLISHGNTLDEFFKIVPQNVLPDWLGGTLSEEEAIDYDLEKALLHKDAYYRDLIQ